MTPTIIPDVATPSAVTAPSGRPAADPRNESAFAGMVDDLGSVLRDANAAEENFAGGAGDLQQAVYERARADVALSVATAAAQRSAQALQAIFTMQV